jgi:TolB protein
LLIVGIVINFFVSRMRDSAPVANGTEVVSSFPAAEDRLIAFSSTQNGNSDIYTMHANGSGLMNLTNDPAYDGFPHWSPDGKQIVFQSDRDGSSQIYLMDADGSNVIQLTQGGDANGFLGGNIQAPWSPDGRKLIFSQNTVNDEKHQFYVLDIATKNTIPLTKEAGKYYSPVWSPDGEHIAFIQNESQENKPGRHIYVVDSQGDQLTKLTENLPKGDYVSYADYYWSSDGQSITFITDSHSRFGAPTVYQASLDGSLGQGTRIANAILDWWNGIAVVADTPQKVDEMSWSIIRADGSQSSLGTCQSPDLAGHVLQRSADGTLAFGSYCSTSGWMLYGVNPEGTTVNQLLNSPLDARYDNLFQMTWSPVDHFLALADLYILNAKDPSAQPLKMENSSSPSWQPVANENFVKEGPTPKPVDTSNTDGLVAFTAALKNGNLDIYTMRPDGSELSDITNDPAHDVNPFWSPDGKWIAFESDRNGFVQIFLINADGSNVVQVTDGEMDHRFENSNPWSPDGSRLLFTERAPGEEKWMLYTINVKGQNQTPLGLVPDIYSHPTWSPDGTRIAYTKLVPVGDRTMKRIFVVDSDGNNTTNVTNLLTEDEDLHYGDFSWSQGGKAISFVAGRVAWENSNGRFAAYEASLDGATLVELTHTSMPLLDWWKGTTFITDFTGETLTWLRSDGTFSTLRPYENCQAGAKTQTSILYSRSSDGYLLIGTGCPNGEYWFYWANPQGTNIRQIFASPIIASPDAGLNSILWSPDNRHVTLMVNSSGITSLYILDVREAIKTPIAPPRPVVIGGGDIYYHISWQPIP